MTDGRVNRSVLVVGNGPYCFKVAGELASVDSVSLAVLREARLDEMEQKPNLVELLMPVELLGFSGQPGEFRAVFRQTNGSHAERTYGFVVVALESEWISTLNKWSVVEDSRITSLSKLEKYVNEYLGNIGPGDKVVFISGFKQDSYPVSQEKIVNFAAAVREKTGAATYVLMEQFKVAQEGLERAFRLARELGVVFVKFSQTIPEVRVGPKECTVQYMDEAMGQAVNISPQLLIFEDEACPPPEGRYISDLLGINLGNQGFLQGDFLFNLPIYTNRTGIFVVGSGKGPISEREAEREAEAVAEEVAKLVCSFDKEVVGPFPTLNENECIHCLTCYRSCPHKAISLYPGQRSPQISPVACRGCGICVESCPRRAIDFEHGESGISYYDIDKEIDHIVYEDSRDVPRIAVFACVNSAYDAYLLAKSRGDRLQARCSVLKVPCGGRVEAAAVIKALGSGVDGVAILTCHEDSCKSVHGASRCRKRIAAVKEMMTKCGVKEEAILFGTVAPGSAPQFVELINRFSLRLQGGDGSSIIPGNAGSGGEAR